MNSHVYAAQVNEKIGGIFTRKDVKRGDILCSYTRTQVLKGDVDPRDVQNLMYMLRRRRP